MKKSKKRKSKSSGSSASQQLLLSEARDKARRLRSLMEMMHTLNATLNLSEILKAAMAIAEKVVFAEVSSLMLLNEEKKELFFEVASGQRGQMIQEKFTLPVGKGVAGWVAKTKKPALIANVRKDKRFFKNVDHVSGFQTRSILCVPLIAKEKCVGILQVINCKRKEGFTLDDLELLQAFAESAALAIENAKLHQASIQEERIKEELRIANEIQKSFLPSTFPKLKEIEVAASMEAAHQVGGDFYDFFMIDEDRLGMIVGDVSGKGAAAALLMARVLSEIRILVQERVDLVELFRQLNFKLCDQKKGAYFVTMFGAVFHLKSKRLDYVNAGHCPGFVFKPSRSQPQFLRASGSVVGALSDMVWRQESTQLEAGDVLALYSDGFLDAMNEKKQSYGQLRLVDAIERAVKQEVSQMITNVQQDCRRFMRQTHPRDDMTLLVAKTIAR